MILYFSGTGNSKYVAEKIAEITGDEILSLNNLMRNKSTTPVFSKVPYVIVAPIYAWRIPRVVESYIKSLELKGSNQAYFITTCAGGSGRAVDYIQKLCDSKSLNLKGYAQVIMPSNHITMFDTPTPEKAKRIIKKADPVIENLGSLIKDEKALPTYEEKGWFLSTIINPIANRLFVKDKDFYSTDECISCGDCVRLCPLNNIKLTGGKPSWHGNCTHCLACIGGCPESAIDYNKVAEKREIYYLEDDPNNL